MTNHPVIFIFLLFVFAFSSNLNQTRLNSLQSKHIHSLLKEQKLGLVFEFRQDANSEGTLFRMRQGYRVLGLSAERKDSTIAFILQIGNELYRTDPLEFDSEFHRLSLQVIENRFQLILDCARIADGQYELKINEGHHKKASIEIGFGQQTNENYPGLLRELSVDLPSAVDLKCTEVKVSPHVRTYRSTMLQPEAEKDNQVAETSVESKENEVSTESQALTAPPSSINDLDRRVHFLESQLQTVREFLHSIDSRLKSVELHQRGCVLNGKRVLSFGEKHQNVRECAECQCSVSGQLHCGPIGCPHLKCLHPIQKQGECCPHCGKQCYYNGVHYEHGVEVWPKQCVRCKCEDGRMECKFHRAEHCPQLACQNQETPPNQCCPVCTNLDYCSAQVNPCNANAICENGQFGAKCTCKQGFFGNGTSCYDIDECLWDDNAREQLGGCQAGTICINLPGSFKCDCLPGFRRLDDKNCLDIIRF